MTPRLLNPSTDTDTEFQRIVDELTRRGFLAGGLGSAALLGLAACGSNNPNGRDSSASASRLWTFTDDLGKTVTLPRSPARIAVLGDGLGASLWAAGVHVVASPSRDNEYTQAGASASQLAGIVAFGNTDDSYNTEALLKVAPDLIVGNSDDGQVFALKTQPELTKVAPVIGMNLQSQSFEAIMASIDRLATATGKSEDTTAHTTYQAQTALLRSALNAKPGLRVMFCFDLGNDGLGVEIVDKWPELQTLSALGTQFVPAKGGASDYFQTVSWENVPTIGADLIVSVAGSAKLPTNPAWSAMPAVKAGQVLNWGNELNLYTWANYTTLFTHLTDAVSTARPGTGPH